MRVCEWCKKELAGASTKKFCGGACRTAASKARTAENQPTLTKTCQWCEKEFQPKTKRAQFCSDKCRNERHLAKKPKPYWREGTCKHCGGGFASPRATRVYCKDECRVDAHFKSLGVDYTSDEDFVQLRNWWLYKYRTEAELYEVAWAEMKEAEEALEDFKPSLCESEEDAIALEAELEDEFNAAKDTYDELMKTRSIDFKAVERGRQKLRDILIRKRADAQYEAIKAEMKEFQDIYSRD